MKNALRLLMSALTVKSVLTDVRGISFFGFETEYENLMCTWKHSIEWNVAKIASLGFNSIRLPFSYDFVVKGDWSQMDIFFDEVVKHNISVVLDFHRIDNTHQSAKPYTDSITFDMFLGAWKTILTRYENNSQLISADIFNEYQSDNVQEWNNLARQIVSYIERYFPERFSYFVGGVSWNGNLHLVDLEDLSYSDRIYYTIHKYQFSDTEPLEDHWLFSFDIAHKVRIVVGEWGYRSTNADEVKWARRFIKWLKSKNITNTYFWTWTFNSGDTGGILLNDCETVDTTKMNTLYDYWNYKPPSRLLRKS